ncbi:MAG: carboxymuconolactone decarboxylase family protein [Candidatus Rokubacteria bacterium]|nr:carboxymuconolactone decarboxylase family protein [Candidatus Rokubacteria bacterium]
MPANRRRAPACQRDRRSHGNRQSDRGVRAGPRGPAVLRSHEGLVQDRFRPQDEPGAPAGTRVRAAQRPRLSTGRGGGALTRAQREILAFAASMTGKSDYGVDFHLREARRLGLTDQALTEAVEVVQLFNTVTTIADALCLEPNFDARRSDHFGSHHPAVPNTATPSITV